MHDEVKSDVAERFIRTVKNKIINIWLQYQKIFILDYIVNKYNTTYHRTIKMKPVDVNQSIYIGFNKENNQKGPKWWFL